MKIDYHNMQSNDNRMWFSIRYVLNTFRTWYYFHIRWPWVKYQGFVRVMHGTTFAHFDISIGHDVQFGDYCNVSAPVKFGSNILMGARVCFVGKNDHTFDVPGQLIWTGERKCQKASEIGDDVWIGHRVTIIGTVKIGRGSVVAAGSVVTKDIPECEIWGGVPARKLKDRFSTEEAKKKHLNFLDETMA